MVSKKRALLSGWQGMPSAGGLQNPGGEPPSRILS